MSNPLDQEERKETMQRIKNKKKRAQELMLQLIAYRTLINRSDYLTLPHTTSRYLTLPHPTSHYLTLPHTTSPYLTLINRSDYLTLPHTTAH